MDAKKRKISETDSNEQVLLNYVDNRIKLMQEVLTLIKPKKIMCMAPDFMKNMQISVVKSLLLEELLGISNKRLRCILTGTDLNIDSSSSSESEIEEKKPADTLSLQEISDESDACIDLEVSEKERLELEKDNANYSKSNFDIKTELVKDDKRKDKHKKKKTSKKVPKTEGEPVVNVLNLLELQARARAIRSQLANELLLDKDEKVDEDKPATTTTNIEEHHSLDENSSDSVICISPDNLSVVSVKSNSDHENTENCTTDKNVSDKNKDNKCKTSENNASTSKNQEESSHESEEEKGTDQADSDKWKARWLESNKVQQAMKYSKLYNNLRQSRKQKNSPKENVDKNLETDCDNSEKNNNIVDDNENNSEKNGDIVDDDDNENTSDKNGDVNDDDNEKTSEKNCDTSETNDTSEVNPVSCTGPETE